MVKDDCLSLLLPTLQQIDRPMLWYADENVATTLSLVPPNPQLTLISNRYDIVQQAQVAGHNAVFSDFCPEDYPLTIVEQIVYRVSKEKALVHFLLNQAATLLSPRGQLVIAGERQDGIKTYGDKLIKKLHASGRLKKHKEQYLGHFSQLRGDNPLDDQDYSQLRSVTTKAGQQFISKPGIFGWNKIDKGTELLLTAFAEYYPQLPAHDGTLLDLGCGYGWIFLNLDNYSLQHIAATDNNAAAISAAQANSQTLTTPVTVVADDCAHQITEKFSLILCNPPFHQGFAHAQTLSEKFMAATARHLQPEGHAFFVVNQFIPVDKLAAAQSLKTKTLKKSQGFKVVLMQWC